MTKPLPKLLSAKIRVPSVAPTLLRRTRLSNLLAPLAQQTPLALLVAPAGFGKTTLAAGWLRQQKDTYHAWYSLDASDNELPRFLSYLHACLHACLTAPTQASPHIASARLTTESRHPKPNAPLNTGPRLPKPSELGGQLEGSLAYLDELLATIEQLDKTILLVLDNCHVLDEGLPAHQALAYLLAHQPPTLHLLLLTRTSLQLGITKRLLKGELISLHEQALAFTLAETGQFLQREYPLLGEEGTRRVYEFTQGWPAALKLLSLFNEALQQVVEHDYCQVQLPEDITGYLFEEVLATFDERSLAFMLISAQVDLFCADLVSAMTGWSFETVRQIMDTIVANRTLVYRVRIADERDWYVYHPLIAQALIRQARRGGGTETAALLTRASHWFDEHGNLNLAAFYAHRVGDYQHLQRIMLQHWEVMFIEDNTYMWYQWGLLLPRERLLANPVLCSIMAYVALLSDDVALSALCAGVAEAHFTTPLVEFYPQDLTLQAQRYLLEQRFDLARQAAREALGLLGPQHFYLRASLLQAEVLATLSVDWCQHKYVIEQILAMLPPNANALYRANNYAFLSFSEAFLGNFTLAFAAQEKALAIPAKASYHYRTTYMNIWYTYMNAAYYRGHLDVAELHQRKHARIVKESFAPQLLALSLVSEGLFLWLRGDASAALEAIVASLRLSPFGLLAVALPFELVALLEDEGGVDLQDFLAMHQAEYGNSVLYKRLLYTHAYLRGGPYDVSALRQTVSQINADDRLSRIHCALLLALFEEEAGCAEAAEHWLAEALNLALPERIVQPFYNEAATLLPLAERAVEADKVVLTTDAEELVVRLRKLAVGEQLTAPDGRGSAQLTSRESDVATLLSAGLSTKNIAERLLLSKETVRKHIANIYGKMGVHSRAQLLQELRELREARDFNKDSSRDLNKDSSRNLNKDSSKDF